MDSVSAFGKGSLRMKDRVKLEQNATREIDELRARVPNLSDMQHTALITMLRAVQPEKPDRLM